MTETTPAREYLERHAEAAEAILGHIRRQTAEVFKAK